MARQAFAAIRSFRLRFGNRRLLLFVLATLAFRCAGSLYAQDAAKPAVPVQAAIVELEGSVEISKAGTATWTAARTNEVLRAGDRVRTGPRSRAAVRLSNLTTIRLGEYYVFSVPLPAPAADREGGFNLFKGLFYLFHRDKPGTFPAKTPSAYAVIIGTEFSIDVDTNGTTVLHLVDGRVDMTNEFGRLELRSGESGRAEIGKAPVRIPSTPSANAIQWCLYYPGVIDPDELDLPQAGVQALAASLQAWRIGDVQGALRLYPDGREPQSDAERVYLASLLLSVGQVENATRHLDAIAADESSRPQQLARALRMLIAAVKFQETAPLPDSHLASVLLARSYYAQSQSHLDEALAFALEARTHSTNFGFAWERVAELEFSFGRRNKASSALRRAIELSPRNAQAFALKGFVLASQNKIAEALRAFDDAIALDGALGNAWLGRGLCLIRRGDAEKGRQDLQTAATLEPQRSALRSYLGKAFSNAGDSAHAINELRIARELDPTDPVAWLYSGLLDYQENRVNPAVRALERSGELTGNRSVVRGPLQLEQDNAVLGVNRAIVFDGAGMTDVAAREAGRAVDADPANYSAHQFLGHSYQLQRDLKGVNQRFETPAVSEFLIANLLSPVGAGTLAQSVSQQEYSKLFESDGPGGAAATDYFSNGDWLQSAAQYGTFGNFGYAASAFVRSDNGFRPNNDLLQQEYSLQLKQQLTPQDSVYARAIYGDSQGGDLAPRYDPNRPNPKLRFHESQEPLLLFGVHHEWAPGSHSLIVGGWFRDDLRVSDPANPNDGALILEHDASGRITEAAPIPIDQRYRSLAEMFTAEAQQIWQTPATSLIAGGRIQGGTLDTESRQSNAGFIPVLFPTDTQRVRSDFERWSLYAYGNWQVFEPLRLVAGVSYDSIRFPVNFRFAPVSTGHDSDDQLSPKGGLVWTPTRRTTVRFGYSQSLGGVGFEQSFRLEPTQVAGFNQAFRSVIPESVAGANADAPFESWGVSLEQRIGSGTFLGLSGEWLASDVRRQIGVYDFNSFTLTRGLTRERLNYHEESLTFTANQLIGDEWAFGARYRLSRARLDDRFTQIPGDAATLENFRAHSEPESVLHQLELSGDYNHPSGFFGRVESLWFAQSNQGYLPDRPGDDFWQFNAFVGWRFLHRHVEARIGVLNLADRDFKLNPLNLTPELPRARTFTTSLRFNF